MATFKQKVAFKEVVNGSSLTKAMTTAGFSPSTAHRTNKLTRTKGWAELMEKHLPDSMLAKKHRELLNKQETIVVHEGKESRVELTHQPHADVKGALDMAYKLKGRYQTEGGTTNNQVIIVQIAGDLKDKYAPNEPHTITEPNSP